MENKFTLALGVTLVISILCIAGVVSAVGLTWENVMWGAIIGVAVSAVGAFMNYLDNITR